MEAEKKTAHAEAKVGRLGQTLSVLKPKAKLKTNARGVVGR